MTTVKATYLYFAFLCIAAASNPWPVIQPLRGGRHCDVSQPGDTPLVVFVRDSRGAPVYKLECHNGDYEDASEMNFSGAFQCALFAVTSDGKRTSWNLLATAANEEQHSDWNNRARMTAGQLWNGCADVPGYGSRRRFKLRGMAITFQFADVRWRSNADARSSHRLSAFTFRFSIVPDKTALGHQTNALTTAPPPEGQ